MRLDGIVVWIGMHIGKRTGGVRGLLGFPGQLANGHQRATLDGWLPQATIQPAPKRHTYTRKPEAMNRLLCRRGRCLERRHGENAVEPAVTGLWGQTGRVRGDAAQPHNRIVMKKALDGKSEALVGSEQHGTHRDRVGGEGYLPRDGRYTIKATFRARSTSSGGSGSM